MVQIWKEMQKEAMMTQQRLCHQKFCQGLSSRQTGTEMKSLEMMYPLISEKERELPMRIIRKENISSLMELLFDHILNGKRLRIWMLMSMELKSRERLIQVKWNLFDMGSWQFIQASQVNQIGKSRLVPVAMDYLVPCMAALMKVTSEFYVQGTQ